MNRPISQFAFYLMLVVTALWTWSNLPSSPRQRPESKLASFSVNEQATRIRRHLHEGYEAERQGDLVLSYAPGQARSFYRRARRRYRRANRFFTESHRFRTSPPAHGYLRDLIRQSQKRLRQKTPHIPDPTVR